MFDSLLNSKFYNKCKHAIKCTRTRLDLVRRKKQAMVKFMKKDVADLIGNRLESHAFGRMEALIVEMNQASCYDMIEQYCEYIVKQLNNLQKQNECPQEALEAVSTLIFATARFPELPELCDLRHMFTERYGSFVEPFVSSEFVQKLQNKSFTNEEKLQVMQSIAEEFSVPFNAKALERKISGVPQNKHDLQNKSSFKRVEVEASARNELKVDRHAVHERKSKVTPEVHERKQEMPVKPKDIHVIPDAIGQVGEKSRKNRSDIPYDVPPSDLKQINDQELKKDHKKHSHHQRELRNADKSAPPYAEPKEDVAEKSDGKGYHVHRSRMAGGLDHNWGHADLGLKTLGLEKQGIEPASSLDGKTLNKAPPYSKPYKASDEYGQSVQDRQKMPEKAVNMRPPYVKPNSTNQAVDDYKHAGTGEIGHQRDGLADDNTLQPVSVRRKSAKPPTHGDRYDDEAKMTSQTPGGRRRHSSRRNGSDDDYDQRVGYMLPPDDAAVNNARHFKRMSERRKHGSRQGGSASGNDYESDEDETNSAIDFGNLLPRAPSSHRKHRSRSAHPRSGGRDDEERVMDKLLMHYSKKGIDREEHKTRTKSRTPRPRADQPADGVGERSNREVAPQHPPERTVSLPSDSGNLGVKPKAPARSISMQPDKSRGIVHPSMPDFDELAARISALRKE
uniref:IST1-like protein n=1 Tax=Oryza barthii TaxID=65489 RepID=A0A0D3F0Z3_9ORYZ